jgi:PTH1 family peptidyl-tRNA hydrolase
MTESETEVRCVVGLGNPGKGYVDTRHNAGFWFVDELARQCGGVFRTEAKFFGETCRISLGGRQCLLLKPTTFMNRSGQSVSALSRFYKLNPAELLVVHDELDMDPGVVRLKLGGGHGGHNGLRDIAAALGSREFLRLRVGIGHPGQRDAVVDYVLSRASKADRERIDAALTEAAQVMPEILAGGLQKAMNRLHSD